MVAAGHDRRRIVHFNVTAHPTAEWTAQQIVEAFPFDESPRFLIRDRDGIYSNAFQNRVESMGIEDLPESLRTDNWEGFTLFRDRAKLYIMGNIPRGTLYGVYDFLDVELGVRFLTAEANHVPSRPTLEVQVVSRSYGPPIERRTK